MCNLKKALYGLKQALWVWFEKFTIVITSLGFCSSEHDSSLFVRTTSHGLTLLCLYVDDMIIIGDDVNEIDDLKLQLAKQFEMTNLGTLHYFLGIEVAYSPKDYLLSQSKYIANIL